MNTLEGENKWSLISCGGTPRFMRAYEMGKADGSALFVGGPPDRIQLGLMRAEGTSANQSMTAIINLHA